MDDFETARQSFFKGLQLLEKNRFDAAETEFARALEIIPDRVSTLNNLAAVKIKLKKFAEAEPLARRAAALDDQSAEAWTNLGIALTETERRAEALPAFAQALTANPAYLKAWVTKAITLLELKNFDEALAACEAALKLNPAQYEALYAKSLALKELGRADEAKKIYILSLEARVAESPVYLAERRPTQQANILILNQNPDIVDGEFKSFEHLHIACPNYPGQIALRLRDEFHFTFVFEGDATRHFARAKIPQPDLILNNHTNGERIISEGKLPVVIALVDSFGVPVINHPTQAVQTTRDVSAKLVEDLPGVIVPKTMRFSSAGKTREELVREIESHYEYPLITRTLASQMGVGMTKVDNRAALLAVLAADFPEKFFVTQFVDSRNGSEFYRKLRVAFVRDETVLVRVDYDDYWKIYARRSDERVAFYLKNPHLLDEEKRLCQDAEAGLGRTVMQSLQKIRSRIPLDVFGMDFDVGADEKIIFYEANATMNLFSTARKEVPNPKAAEDSLHAAFRRYFTSLVNRC